MARITKTLQLVEGVDDDLIAWFESLSKGDGQRIIKEKLRLGINCNNPDSNASNPPRRDPPADPPPAPIDPMAFTDAFKTAVKEGIEQAAGAIGRSVGQAVAREMKKIKPPANPHLNALDYADDEPEPSHLDELAMQTEDPQATMDAAMNVVNLFG